MYAIDFEYDNQYVSDYGFIVCNFNASSGANTVDAGSKITFNKIAKRNGKENSLIGMKYGECLQCQFDICKNPDIYDYKDRKITTDEFRDIMRWLNRPEFHRFQIIDNSEKFREPCYFNASFNIEKIFVADELYGLRLTMETDKPFGYGEKQKYVLDAPEKYVTTGTAIAPVIPDLNIYDTSDEIGETYVDIDITCYKDGTIVVNNRSLGSGKFLEIKNCKQGEKIHIDGNNLIITSSNSSHNIANDFNYNFLKIRNTFTDRKNRIVTNTFCKIEISYTPIIKDIPT